MELRNELAPTLPSEAEAILAKETSLLLASRTQSKDPLQLRLLDDPSAGTVTLPTSAVRMLVHDLHVIVIDRDTGEILRELDIDPTKDSQPRGVKPGPRPGHRKGGMPKGYKFPQK